MNLLKQVTNGYSEEQMNNFWGKVKQFGIPDETIKQVQQEILKK